MKLQANFQQLDTISEIEFVFESNDTTIVLDGYSFSEKVITEFLKLYIKEITSEDVSIEIYGQDIEVTFPDRSMFIISMSNTLHNLLRNRLKDLQTDNVKVFLEEIATLFKLSKNKIDKSTVITLEVDI